MMKWTIRGIGLAIAGMAGIPAFIAGLAPRGGEYLSRFGFILSTLFTLIIIVETLPVFAYLDGC